MSPVILLLLVGAAASAFKENYGPNSDVSDLDLINKRAGNTYNWISPATDEKRSRNPYSWMRTQGKRARNPYSWMANRQVTKRSPRHLDDLFRAPRNPYSWQYTMFDKRARNPYSWMNE